MIINNNIVEIKNEFKYESKYVYTKRENVYTIGVWNGINHISTVGLTPDQLSSSMIEINRDLYDDHINAKFKYWTPDKTFGRFSSLFEFNGNNHDMPNYNTRVKSGEQLPNNVLYQLPTSTDDLKFKDLKSSMVGMIYKLPKDENREKYIENTPTSMLQAWIDKPFPLSTIAIKTLTKNNQNLAEIKENEILELSTENTLSYYLGSPGGGTNEKTFNTRFESLTTGEKEIKADIEYNHLFLVPVDFNTDKPNKVLFHVLTYNDKKRSIDRDYNIKNGYMTTSADEEHKIELNFVQNDKPILTSINDKSAYYLGDININGYSEYDYDNKKTIFGISPNSIQGEIIPYGLKGNYKREIHLSLNSEFDDFTIFQTKNIEKKMLDENEGIIKLKLDNDLPNNYFKLYPIEWKEMQKLKNGDIKSFSFQDLTNQ